MSEQIMMDGESVSPESTTHQVNPIRLAELQQKLLSKQNFFGGLIAGLIAALVAALIWAVITAVTGFQIGWMAIGVGYAVGFAVRSVGRGITPLYQILGAALSLFGCLAGNLMTFAMIFSQQEPAISFFAVMGLFLSTPAAVTEALTITFSPIDILFYALAIFQGYKLSRHRLTDGEMAELMAP